MIKTAFKERIILLILLCFFSIWKQLPKQWISFVYGCSKKNHYCKHAWGVFAIIKDFIDMTLCHWVIDSVNYIKTTISKRKKNYSYFESHGKLDNTLIVALGSDTYICVLLLIKVFLVRLHLSALHLLMKTFNLKYFRLSHICSWYVFQLK